MSITGPRAVFTMIADGFIDRSAAASMRCRVSAVRLTLSDTKSDWARRSASGSQVAPVARSTSSATRWRAWYSTRMPKPAARRATACPMRPKPTMPSVAPWTSRPSSSTGPQVRHSPGADRAIALDDAACGREQQRPGEVRGGLGEHARRVADRDASPCAGRHVDVVVADAEVRDDPQLRPGGVEELVVHAVREQREQPVDPGDPAEQGLARRRQLLLPEVEPARLAQRRQALVGDDAGDEDARPVIRGVGHPRMLPEGSGPIPARGRVRSRSYNRGVSRYYSIDDANALVPDLQVVVGRLRAQRDELIGLRDAYREREDAVTTPVSGGPGASAEAGAAAPSPRTSRTARPATRSCAACACGCAASSTRCRPTSRGSTTGRSPCATSRRGLLDFPALVSGRQVWLCWRLGEDDVAFWHGHDEGFAGRRPLANLPDTPARA